MTLKAKELTPVFQKSQAMYLIDDVPYAEIMQKAQECMDNLDNPENLNHLLQIRAQLASKFKPVNDLIEKIEEKVKAAGLEEGEHGFMSVVKVSYAKKTTVNDKAIFEHIKESGKDPLDYAKVISITDPVIKSIITLHPEVATVDPKGMKKHSFK